MEHRNLSDYSIKKVATTEYRNQRLNNVDFSGQRLDHLRFFDCTLTHCSFDHATCRDLRMWGTTLCDCTFSETDLRDSALGGIQNGKCNRFERVQFQGTDMRGTAYTSAEFTNCCFDHVKLAKVDFQGSRFKHSIFRGELQEVLFYDHGFQGEAFEPNRMENVDLSGAQLRWVEFRRLDLETTVLPSDEDHIIIPNYPAFLDYALRELQGATSLPDRVLLTRFQMSKKWLAPRRRVGIFNRLDFLERPEGNETISRLTYLLANVA